MSNKIKKRILSVDFDIIMYPCIKLYNHLVGGEENATQQWQRLEDMLEIEKHLDYDGKLYVALMGVLRKLYTKDNLLIVIQEHQEIIDCLKQMPEYDNATYDIVNVDFHHDLGYAPNTTQQIVDFDEYNCANWLGYLRERGLTDRLTWVAAPNSERPQNSEIEIVPISRINALKHEEFDYIFLCNSPQWVPYKYQHLFDALTAALVVESDVQ